MASRASPLRAAIRDRFFPVAEAHGFVRRKAAHPLFTDFRREGEGKVQLFDIQWDKYHRPSFVLNFGEAPCGDLNVHGTLVLAEQVGPANCPFGGRLQRFKDGSLSCWFRLRKPWREVVRFGGWNYRPEQVADEVIGAFKELEEWWTSKVEGLHVYVR